MTQSFVNRRYWILLAVPILFVALSSCGSSSTDTLESETSTTAEETESGAVDQEDSEAEGSDQESVEPEATDPGDDEQSTTDGPDGATAFNQPNILLVITDDQGLDASAQYSLSDDLPNTPVIDSLARNGITLSLIHI